jgi:FecR-like protein
MSERPTGPVLERLTEEARSDAVPPPGAEVDWAAVDAKLFARVEAEAKAGRRLRPVEGGSRLWLGVAAALAAAAGAVVVFARHPREAEHAELRASEPASTFVSREGEGLVRIEGHDVTSGASLAFGDAVETTQAARAILVRPSGDGTVETPRVRWSLEPSSRARVLGGSTLVVALERGAVEAEVTPVASGEAFAVDVGGTRIAVHGTHLRVARSDDRVVVDLSRGVLSIGDAPRVGSTYGELVTSPAHVEFSASAPHASMRVDHDPSSVRAPVSFEIPVAATPPPGLTAPAVPPLPPAVAPPSPPSVAPKPSGSSAPAPPDSNPEAAIERAVEACIGARPHADEVTVTVSSMLTITVGDDGLVHGPAQFAPPLPPEVQSCASATIFRVRFKEPGLVSIPIHVER